MDDRDQIIVEESDRTVVEIQEDEDTRSVVVDSEIITVVSAVEQGLPGAGDKHFSQAFNVSTSVTATHNLGKRPAVTVINSAGDEVISDVHYVSDNELTVSFSAAFSGVLYLN